MKKLFLLCFFLIACAGSNEMAAQKQMGIFNSVALGISAGTTGIEIDLASPIGNHIAIRGGVSFMPNFSLSDDVDVDISSVSQGAPSTSSINLEGGLGRTSGALLVNIYPFKSSGLFICGGVYLGGDKLIKIKGHSEELKQLIAEGGTAGVEIGDYFVPVNKNGDIAAGLKVATFRPYLGLGMGRVVPKCRLGFMFEAGVQFHKTPKVYADNANLDLQLNEMADNDFSDIIDNLKIYPVIKLRLCGRIF